MSKKQVIAVHGGNSYSDYEKFLSHMRAQEIDPYEKWPDGWRKNLPQLLGDEYDILLPSMPNSQNAKYEEWKIWFEKYLTFTPEEVQLVGHSLGAMFLVRYLAEEEVSVNIVSLHLVAGAYEPLTADGEYDDGGDFYTELKNVSCIAQKAQKIFVYHSQDDPVVPYAHMAMLANQIPSAITQSFTNRNHFLQPDFPELIADLQKTE